MSRLAKFILTILGGVLPAFLRNYLDRVEADGGATVDRDHIVEVYEDTNPYNPTLIQSCESGKATVAYSLFAFDDVDDFELRVVAGGGTNESTRQDALFAQHLWRNDLHNNASLVVPCASHKAGRLYAYQPTVEPDTTLLDYYTGSAAAYSLRSLSASTTNVVKVRRSSDDTEQDFTAAEITDGTLLTFVNEDVDIYTSDFTSGNEDLSEFKGTGSDGETVAGVSDAYKFTVSGGLALHYPGINSIFNVNTYNVSFDYYVPSGQTVGGLLVATSNGGDGLYPQTVVDEWTSVTITNWNITLSSQLRFYAYDSSAGAINFTADGDVFYLKNIVITQTTADGHVTTWYDQSGNGYNATQATAANQPKIVSSGSLITNNGKAAIEGDGSGRLQTSDIVLSSDLTMVAVASFDTGMLFGGTSPTTKSYIWRNSPGSIAIRNINENGFNSFTVSFGTQDLFFARREGTTIGLSVNGTETTNTENATQGLDFTINRIGGGYNNVYDLDGKYQEMIFWNTSQSANRTGIEANINDYYNIYP